MHLCEALVFVAPFGQRKYVVKSVGHSGHIKYACIEYQYVAVRQHCSLAQAVMAF